VLVALGVAAVEAGHRVRYFTAADLVETLYRALADNSVGRVIDTLLRNDLPEHTTAVSMLDRLLHHCHVVITNGDSYRMKQARARGGGVQKPS
jgi:DNA replication protein DnaC